MYKVIILFILISLYKIDTTQAKVLYVNQNSGSSYEDGSQEASFKTISNALSNAKENDTIYIYKGVYRETITPTVNNLLIEAVEDSVIITGTDLITNWEYVGGYLYKAYLPQECTQLFVNSLPQPKAKYPNGFDPNNLFNFSTIEINYYPDNKIVTSSALNQPDGYWTGGTIWMLVGDRWVAQTGRIVSSSNGQLTIDYVSASYGSDGIAFITNTINALDTIGEWFWQNDTLYYMTDKDINTLKIEAKTREHIIYIYQISGTKIINIQGFAGNVLLDGTSNSLIKNCKFTYLSHLDYIDKENVSWYSSYSRHAWTSPYSYGIGIGLFGENDTVDECRVEWSAGDCITLYGTNNIVKNSIIQYANYLGTDCAPIALGGTGNQILHNEIAYGGREVITALSAKQFKVKYNRVHHSGLLCWDVGLFYTYDTDGENGEIAYNWFSDSYSGNPDDYWGGEGVYLDNNSRNYLVHHNVIWNIKGSGIKFNQPAINNRAYNNTIFNTKGMTTYLSPNFDTIPSSDCKFYNNYLDVDVLQADWLDAQNNISDPTDYLVDRSNNDFRPLSNSPLIGTGRAIDEIGMPEGCDVGAYQLYDNWTVGPYSEEADENSTSIKEYKIDFSNSKEYLYPIPVLDTLYINNKDNFLLYSIFTQGGRLVKTGSIKTNKINMSHLKAGIYIIILKNLREVKRFKIYKTDNY